MNSLNSALPVMRQFLERASISPFLALTVFSENVDVMHRLGESGAAGPFSHLATGKSSSVELIKLIGEHELFSGRIRFKDLRIEFLVKDELPFYDWDERYRKGYELSMEAIAEIGDPHSDDSLLNRVKSKLTGFFSCADSAVRGTVIRSGQSRRVRAIAGGLSNISLVSGLTRLLNEDNGDVGVGLEIAGLHSSELKATQIDDVEIAPPFFRGRFACNSIGLWAPVPDSGLHVDEATQVLDRYASFCPLICFCREYVPWNRPEGGTVARSRGQSCKLWKDSSGTGLVIGVEQFGSKVPSIKKTIAELKEFAWALGGHLVKK